MAKVARATLKVIADEAAGKKNKREASLSANAASKIEKRRQQSLKQCYAAMLPAAKAGKHLCEVTIDFQDYAWLKASLAEYSPSINGDGYSHTVICLRWD